MKRHLFYTFLLVFAVTSIITLLGIIGVVTIAHDFLWALSSAFLIVSAGAVVALFKRNDFFTDSEADCDQRIADTVAKLKAEHSLEKSELVKLYEQTISDMTTKAKERVFNDAAQRALFTRSTTSEDGPPLYKRDDQK